MYLHDLGKRVAIEATKYVRTTAELSSTVGNICRSVSEHADNLFVFLAEIEDVINMIHTFNEHPRFYP